MKRWQNVMVDDSAMRCYVAETRNVNSPGVLVCMHGPGVDAFIIDICDRLALSGFVAIAPDLYHRQSKQPVEAREQIKDNEALNDMARATSAMKALPSVDAHRLGVIGFCMGGRFSFLQAANDPDLKASVVFHGGNIMVARDSGLTPYEQAGNIRAPMLGLFGSDDQDPSPSDVKTIDSELTRLGKMHKFYSYKGAGHAFLNFTRPSAFRESQAKEAWTKCLEWLHQYL